MNRQRFARYLIVFLFLITSSGCRGTLKDIKATNPDDETVVMCDATQDTNCYLSFTGEIEFQENLYLCLHFTFNRGSPDYWVHGGGPLDTASQSKIWTMISGGLGEDNRFNAPPFIITALLTDSACVGQGEFLLLSNPAE